MQIYFRGYTKKVILEVTVFTRGFLFLTNQIRLANSWRRYYIIAKKTRCKIKYRPTLTTPILMKIRKIVAYSNNKYCNFLFLPVIRFMNQPEI